MARLQIAVLGAGALAGDRRGEDLRRLAFAVGEALGSAGARLICGGRGGVMEAACRGARAAGGDAVGILPGSDARDSPPNEAVGVTIYTGIGQARNLSVVLSAAAAIVVGGGWGTLSEVALALKHGIPVVLLESWSLRRPDGRREPLLAAAGSAGEAVRRALEMADRRRLG